MKLLVLVLGADGQLGEAMVRQLCGAARGRVARARATLDITDADAVRARSPAICPDVIINCAAYTNVDRRRDATRCTALAVNAWPCGRWRAPPATSTPRSSTSAPTSSSTARPIVHTPKHDPPNPRGTYAVSKLLGEWFAAECAAPLRAACRKPVRRPRTRAAASIRSSTTSAPGAAVRAFSDRTRLAELRRRRRRRDDVAVERAQSAGPLSLRQQRLDHLGRHRARARSPGRPPRTP